MAVGLSGLLLAVPTVLAVLRGGRGRRHRRDDRHRPGPGGDGGAALLLRAGILRAAVLLRATLSPPATRTSSRYSMRCRAARLSTAHAAVDHAARTHRESLKPGHEQTLIAVQRTAAERQVQIPRRLLVKIP